MTREEYLKELDANLITLPKEERDMAVSFYSEYFDDAGPENEQATIEELGKPYNLARSIIGETSAYSKSEVYLKYKQSKPMPKNSTGVFVSLQKPGAFNGVNPTEDTAKDVMPPKAAENAFEHTKAEPQETYPGGGNNANGAGMFDDYYRHGNDAEQTEQAKQQYTPPPPPPHEDKSPVSGIMIAVLVLLLIFVGPPALGIAAGMFAIGVAAIACLAAAAVCLIVGLTRFVVSAPQAVGLLLASMMCAGVGLMLLAMAILFFFKFLPWLIRCFGKLFGKRRAA